jgi:peptide/nickel transport system permease protein
MLEPGARDLDVPPSVTRPRRARLNGPALAGAALLALFYGLAVVAPFVAPYAEDAVDRAHFYHPPQRLHWIDPRGRVGPFVYPTVAEPGDAFVYREDRSRAIPLRFLVRGARYRLLGVIPGDRHLFGSSDSQVPVFLFGADALGRDVLSRLLYGAQISLSVGLVGIALSLGLGLLIGGLSGYLGGAVDAVLMRSSELLLSIPVLYLVVGLRTLFPADLPSRQIYLAIVAILALIGWASLARVIRGMVLSIRSADYVAAAEALGMGRMRVLVRHILPNTASYVIVAATLAVPGYILGEVFLSFLGVGVQEPSASWGNMLNQANSLRVMQSFPWMLIAPATAIFLTVLAFNFLGDGLRDALDPRGGQGARSG